MGFFDRPKKPTEERAPLAAGAVPQTSRVAILAICVSCGKRCDASHHGFRCNLFVIEYSTFSSHSITSGVRALAAAKFSKSKVSKSDNTAEYKQSFVKQAIIFTRSRTIGQNAHKHHWYMYILTYLHNPNCKWNHKKGDN